MFALSRRLLAEAAKTTTPELAKAIPLSELNALPARAATQHMRKKRGIKDDDLIKNWNVAAGDQVVVIAGDAKGEKGIVKKVVRSKNAVIVENVNMRTRVFKPNPEIRGRKFKREGLVHVSNVMLVDPKEKKPTRVKYTFTSAGNKLRVSKKSSMVIPRNSKRLIPALKDRHQSSPSPFDTSLNDAAQHTLRPTLEANGVDPLHVLLLKAKNRRLPEGYKAPLEVVGQVWAYRLEQRAREREERKRREQQSQAQLAINAATVAATSTSSPSAASSTTL